MDRRCSGPEPNINVPGRATAGLVVESGTMPTGDLGTPLYDLVTAQLLLQPARFSRRRTRRHRSGLQRSRRDRRSSSGVAISQHAASSAPATLIRGRVRRAGLLGGLLPETLRLGHVSVHTSLWLAIGVAYAAAYARMAPDELPCGVSFAATDAAGVARPPTGDELARMFSDSNGNRADRKREHRRGWSGRETAQHRRCQRRSRVVPAGSAPQGSHLESRPRPPIRGRDRRPLVLIHGRGDGLIAVNHSSRPYYYASAAGDPAAGIRYYEIKRGQHFDAFLPLPGFAGHYVAMQPFFDAAMDLLDANLSSGQRLPPSQVVREAILAAPGKSAITLGDHVLRVPGVTLRRRGRPRISFPCWNSRSAPLDVAQRPHEYR